MRPPSTKIALYQPYPHTFAGLQTVVMQLARTLPGHGYEPIVICPEEGKFTEIARAHQIDCVISDPGPDWHIYGRGAKSFGYLLSPRRVLGLAKYWFKLRRELRCQGVALVHCNDYRGAMLAAPAARLAGIPAIWHMHGFVSSRLANLAAALLARQAVPVSRGMLDYLKLPEWMLGRYEVIHNGVEFDPVTEALAPSSEVNSSSAGHPDAKAPVILAVGTIHPRKGYETLLHAIKRVSARMPQVECWIAGGEFGDGSYGRELRELARRLGVEPRVKFLGHSADVSGLMRRCSVLALPSRVEVFGLVALEAMRAGKPVVACRTGGLPEIIAHRETGVLVTPGDSARMAMALTEILDNPALAERMGAAGRQRVREHFSLEKMTAAVAALYRRLIENPAKRPTRPACPAQPPIVDHGNHVSSPAWAGEPATHAATPSNVVPSVNAVSSPT